MGLDLREFELLVLRVHQLDLVHARCSENFNDLDELIDGALSGKERLPQNHLGDHAT